jgi:ubiquinone/menaquinone biosynthesis C-methylase UbiE/uncharacterized protein YbaR (Trm112 family)
MTTSLGQGFHAPAGQVVDSAAYDGWVGRWSRLFVPMVISAAGVTTTQRVLDISTGTGEAALTALPIVGAAGLLVGADIAPAMLEGARERLNNPHFHPVAADGQALPFKDDSFDAVVCQLGLQFFPDPARGLSEFRRVLRPGASAAVCVISTPDRAPMWGVLAEALGRRIPEQRRVLNLSFALADQTRLRSLFTNAGFQDVHIERVEREDSIESFDEYWEPIEAGTGSIPQMYVSLGEGERRAVREEVKTHLSRFLSNGKLVMSFEMLIGRGCVQRPDKDPHVSKSDGLRDVVKSGSLELAKTRGQNASLDSRLVDILCCPVTKGPLDYDRAARELISRASGLAFPIRDSIPIMLTDAARKLA